MIGLRRVFLLCILCLLCAAPALSVQRFPPPQFETDHTIPTATTPPARSQWLGTLDVAVLLATLSLASWLVLKKRSRKWIVVLMLFSLAYFGFWRKGCVCSVGSIGNIALAIFNSDYTIPWTVVVFFFAPLVFTLFFGRSFCAAVCPLGAIQDIVLLRPLRVPIWLETALRLAAWLYLLLAILFAATATSFIICRYDPFIAFFRLNANPAIWVISISMLVIAVFVGRPYCRFLCPYGLLLRQIGRISLFRVTITPDECIHCRLCEEACPFGAIEKPTVQWPSREYARGRTRLLTLFCLLPVFIAAGVWGGCLLHPKLASNHPTVRLAQQTQDHQSGLVEEMTDEIKAFYTSGQSLDDLTNTANAKQKQFAIGAPVIGGIIGLIAGFTLIAHSIFWKRTGYEAQRTGCIACGRCYNYCPRHRKWLSEKMKNQQNKSQYQSAIALAIVAAVFSIIVAGLLAANVYSMKVSIPARSAELEIMKEQAKANPADATLAQLILDVDTQLRRDQFAGLYFVRRGTILLVITLVLLIGSIIWAVSHRPKLPQPQPQGDLKAEQVQQAHRTRRAFSAAVILLCAAALFWVLNAPQTVPESDSGQTQALYASMEQMENQWPVFRGSGGLGICNIENIPDTWDGKTGKNILWKTPIPLPGHNSPVVWDDRIFLTGATEDKQQVFCYDAQTGQLLWTGDISIPPSPQRDDMDIMEDTGYAACTAVTDGKRVCAIFAGGDMGCFTTGGKLLWEKHLGVPESAYGYAASLTAFEDRVIVQWDVGYDDGDESKSKLIALNWQTGNILFQTHRPVPNSWSSPTVVKIAQQYQILTTASPFVIAYDPKTGTELYRAECIEGDIAAPPIVSGNKLFAIEPYNKLVAVNTENASGDITATHILWENESEMPDICSPVASEEFVWTLITQGLLGCYRVADGEEVYTHDIEDNFQASPTLVGDRIYLPAENGTMVIIDAGGEYKEIERNELGEKCYASPAFQAGRIYIRAKENLYAIGTAQ